MARPPLPRWPLLVLFAMVLALTALYVYRVVRVYRFDLDACPAAPAAAGPAAVEATGAPPTLLVASYNIMGRGALLDGAHLDGVARVMIGIGADVIALQEVHRGTWQSRFTDQLGELARRTGMNGSFGGSFSELGGSFGNAVLARGALRECHVTPLPSFGEPRSLLACTVEVGGRPLRVFVTHLTPWGALGRASRGRQAACVAAHLGAASEAAILAADLNGVADAGELAPLLASPLLRWAGPAGEVTFPRTGQRLDFVCVGPGMEILDFWVVPGAPSDHHLIVVRLRWEGGPDEAKRRSG